MQKAYSTAFIWNSSDILLKSVRSLSMPIGFIIFLVLRSDFLIPAMFTAACWALGAWLSPGPSSVPLTPCPHE